MFSIDVLNGQRSSGNILTLHITGSSSLESLHCAVPSQTSTLFMVFNPSLQKNKVLNSRPFSSSVKNSKAYITTTLYSMVCCEYARHAHMCCVYADIFSRTFFCWDKHVMTPPSPSKNILIRMWFITIVENRLFSR